MDAPMNIPDSGAIFVFGGKKLNGSSSSCFWLKNDAVVSASCGDEHTALVTDKGKVYVFGSNNWGQLGLGHTCSVDKPTCIRSLQEEVIILVACGRNHTLVCTNDNKLFGFGSNGDSQLAERSVTSSDSPIQIDTESIERITQIDAGADYSILLTEKGVVYVWGSNTEGQLGLGRDINESIRPTRLQIPDAIKSVGCGYYHTALVSVSGELYTFGEDEFGKLGNRGVRDHCLPCAIKFPIPTIVDKVACGGSHTSFVSQDGSLYTFGAGFHGELGHGEDLLETATPKCVEYLRGQEVSQIHCGENFTSVILGDGSLYTFGDGRNGKLGLYGEDFSNQFLPCFSHKLSHYEVKFVSCGGCHMLVSACTNVSRELGASNRKDSNSTWMGLDDHYISCSGTGSMSELMRTSSARKKRRQARSNLPHQTLRSLSSLNSDELKVAVKTLSKSMNFEHTASDDIKSIYKPSLNGRDLDGHSDVSDFNKVHSLAKYNGRNLLTPISCGVASEPKLDPPTCTHLAPECTVAKTTTRVTKEIDDLSECSIQKLPMAEKQRNGAGSPEKTDDAKTGDNEVRTNQQTVGNTSEEACQSGGANSPIIGDSDDSGQISQDAGNKRVSQPPLYGTTPEKDHKKSKLCTIL